MIASFFQRCFPQPYIYLYIFKILFETSESLHHIDKTYQIYVPQSFFMDLEVVGTPISTSVTKVKSLIICNFYNW